jgi:hypothetical protein
MLNSISLIINLQKFKTSNIKKLSIFLYYYDNFLLSTNKYLFLFKNKLDIWQFYIDLILN